MKSNKINILFLLGLLFITAALSLAGYNVWQGMHAGLQADRVISQLELDDEQINITDKELPGFEVDGIDFVGVVEVPALNLQLPVASYWDESAAKVAPCRYAGSPYSGDMIIAGHNYRSHFGGLRNLAPGDEVYFVDMEGSVFSYIVVSMETVDGADVPEMKSGSGTDLLTDGAGAGALDSGDFEDNWDLTLFTCNFSGQARLAVRCVEQ